MNLLTEYLAKFRALRAPESVLRQAVLKAAQGMGIPSEGITIKVRSGVAFLDTNPLIKAECMLKKSELLKLANDELGPLGRRLSDIR